MSRRVRRALIAALAVSLAAATGAVAQERFELRESRREFDARVRRADAAKVVATELAFARLAQEKGQWTAFAEFAADDAVMFVPEPVNAKDWLRKQRNPAQAVRWQPHQVWSSCDGSLAVAKGAWQRPDGSVGYFTTVWQRQENGEYRWVMDQGDVLAAPLEAPEMIGAAAADCGSAPSPVVMSGRGGNVSTEGRSDDGTLYWIVTVRPDGSRSLLVKLWRGGDMGNVLSEEVAAGS